MDHPLPYEVVFDFSRDGVLRSLEDSLRRLDMDRIDIALIHDPDDHHDQAISEAFPALAELRSQGVIGAIGAGMNEWEALARFAVEGDFDCFLLAGRYTLLDQSGLAELLPLCEQRGISVILGGPYNSGVLASDLSGSATYFYAATPPEVLLRAREIKTVCDRHEVPLKAAALQFGLAHPAVAATIPGAQSVAEVEENVAMVQLPIPGALWDELRGQHLIPAEAPSSGCAAGANGTDCRKSLGTTAPHLSAGGGVPPSPGRPLEHCGCGSKRARCLDKGYDNPSGRGASIRRAGGLWNGRWHGSPSAVRSWSGTTRRQRTTSVCYSSHLVT